MSEHKTVFKKEAVDLLKIKQNGVYIDATFGSGGHSLEILKREGNPKLFAFDLDKNNIDTFQSEYKEVKITLINDNFKNIQTVLNNFGIEEVDGILADLGWSSDQFTNIPGLSFESDFEELDMRLGKDFGVKAKDLLNALGKKELSKMFEDYSDIRGFQNQRIVSAVINARKNRAFESVGDLNKVIDSAFNVDDKSKQKISERAKVFQALRIAVNNEKQNLTEFLENGWKVLKSGGNFVVITFHSGEDKIVRNFFNNLVNQDLAEYSTKQYGEVYTRPSVEELTENLRSRSSKLWGVTKK